MMKIDFQPSPFDRLDPVARCVRWWTSQMLDIAGEPRRTTVSVETLLEAGGRLPPNIAIALTDADGFAANVTLPKGNADAHRQALELQLADLAPIAPEHLCIVATATDLAQDDSFTYTLAMGRRERLDELERAARKKGARSVTFEVGARPEPRLASPSSLQRRQRSTVIDASIVVCVVAATVLAAHLWTTRIATEAEAIAQEERSVRSAAIAAQASKNEHALAAALVERGVLNRRSTTALSDIATLNAGTPDGAWWTRFNWTPEEITISAQGQNATAVLGDLSRQAKGWTIELGGALATAPADGLQVFDIVARPRKGAPG